MRISKTNKKLSRNDQSKCRQSRAHRQTDRNESKNAIFLASHLYLSGSPVRSLGFFCCPRVMQSRNWIRFQSGPIHPSRLESVGKCTYPFSSIRASIVSQSMDLIASSGRVYVCCARTVACPLVHAAYQFPIVLTTTTNMIYRFRSIFDYLWTLLT